MTPEVHTTITYGMDTGTIYGLIALGWMGMMAVMLYSERSNGCVDEEISNTKGNGPMNYARNELVSADDFANNMDTLIDKLKNHEVERIGILYNDTLSAVVVSHDQYQRLSRCSKLYAKEEIINEDTANTHSK